MTVLDIANVITVSLVDVPSGLSNVNMNSVCLLTNETPNNIDDYRIYLNPAEVAVDYGTNSETYALANGIFSQNPNLLSGKGRLVIAPMVGAVSATPGSWHTADISANLVALLAVTNGDIRVTLDGGAPLDLTGLNFTNCVDLEDIATILQKRLENVIVTATSTAINFESKKVGSASSVVVSVLTGGSGTNLAASGLLNTAAGTAASGVNSSGETLVAALLRVRALVQFVGWFTNIQVENTIALATALANEALPHIWVHTWSSTTDLAGIISSIYAAGYDKTRCGLYTTDLDSATLMRATYIGGRFSVDFSASNTFSVPFLKQMTGLPADPGINQTTYNNAQAAGAFTYDNFNFAGLSNPRYDGSRKGKYFDEVYGDQWLVFGLQVAGFNSLAATPTRIPQTEAGMTTIKDALIQVLNQGVRVGFMAPGKWNAAATFGDPATFVASVLAVGYYIYSTPIIDQPQPEREERISPTIQIAIKRAGAIQKVFVLVLAEA